MKIKFIYSYKFKINKVKDQLTWPILYNLIPLRINSVWWWSGLRRSNRTMTRNCHPNKLRDENGSFEWLDPSMATITTPFPRKIILGSWTWLEPTSRGGDTNSSDQYLAKRSLFVTKEEANLKRLIPVLLVLLNLQ